jgi:hypothetical protein
LYAKGEWTKRSSKPRTRRWHAVVQGAIALCDNPRI